MNTPVLCWIIAQPNCGKLQEIWSTRLILTSGEEHGLWIVQISSGAFQGIANYHNSRTSAFAAAESEAVKVSRVCSRHLEVRRKPRHIYTTLEMWITRSLFLWVFSCPENSIVHSAKFRRNAEWVGFLFRPRVVALEGQSEKTAFARHVLDHTWKPEEISWTSANIATNIATKIVWRRCKFSRIVL